MNMPNVKYKNRLRCGVSNGAGQIPIAVNKKRFDSNAIRLLIFFALRRIIVLKNG